MGRYIGNYLVLETVGRGAYGTVCKAQNRVSAAAACCCCCCCRWWRLWSVFCFVFFRSCSYCSGSFFLAHWAVRGHQDRESHQAAGKPEAVGLPRPGDSDFEEHQAPERCQPAGGNRNGHFFFPLSIAGPDSLLFRREPRTRPFW